MIVLLAKIVHANILNLHAPVVFKGAWNGGQLDACHHNDNKHASSLSQLSFLLRWSSCSLGVWLCCTNCCLRIAFRSIALCCLALCSATLRLLGIFFFRFSVVDVGQNLLSRVAASSGLRGLQVENILVGVNFRIEDDSGGESISEISDSVWTVRIDIANINVESGGVFLVVANDIYMLYINFQSKATVEEFVHFEMSDTHRNAKIISLARYILLEENFFDEIFSVELNTGKHAKVILACHANVHSLQRILLAQSSTFHCFSRQNNIDFLLFVLGIRRNDTRTLAFLLQLQHQVRRLTNFSVNDVFTLIEDHFVEKCPSGGSHSKFREMFGHEMGYVAEVGIAMQQRRGGGL